MLDKYAAIDNLERLLDNTPPEARRQLLADTIFPLYDRLIELGQLIRDGRANVDCQGICPVAVMVEAINYSLKQVKQ